MASLSKHGVRARMHVVLDDRTKTWRIEEFFGDSLAGMCRHAIWRGNDGGDSRQFRYRPDPYARAAKSAMNSEAGSTPLTSSRSRARVQATYRSWRSVSYTSSSSTSSATAATRGSDEYQIIESASPDRHGDSRHKGVGDDFVPAIGRVAPPSGQRSFAVVAQFQAIGSIDVPRMRDRDRPMYLSLPADAAFAELANASAAAKMRRSFMASDIDGEDRRHGLDGPRNPLRIAV